ncbi:MAG: RimK family alpha-L-glutamate ligase [Pseudomonadota bacterium]|nr:RimK family alpha-L-glutamate ligase [Pseudomonadota bacterium]
MTPALALEQTCDIDGQLMGLARLMKMAFRGVDLRPLAAELIGRAAGPETDANALMDLSTVLLLSDVKTVGLAVQAEALQASRVYRLASSQRAAVRLLSIMSSGDLMVNAPLPFLFEDSDIELTMIYLQPGEQLPRELPEHDAMIVAISQSDRTLGLLKSLSQSLQANAEPIFNRPAGIARTCRSEAYRHLAGLSGLVMPPTSRTTRAFLSQIARGELGLGVILEGGALPLIVRPVDSHAGRGLSKIGTLGELVSYLDGNAFEEFFISPFIDYRSPDGQFRKYRVALVDGVPFAAHMGISEHWMIHYLNAGMTESAPKRAEEERFMRAFKTDFSVRHQRALEAVSNRFELELLVIDCAETAAGELLVFEMDPAAVVHSMDPEDLFPYKRENMAQIYSAFRAMLARSIDAACHKRVLRGPTSRRH